MEHETFLSLLRSPAHLELEVFLTIVQDVLIGAFLWPLIKRRFKREHAKIDAEHGVTHMIHEDAHLPYCCDHSLVPSTTRGVGSHE